MSFYVDEFLFAKPGSFEKREFNTGVDQTLETEVSESLNAFGIRGKVVGSEVGPYITRVYFKLDRGVRFNSIEPLTEDLKMTLRAPSIKIMPEPEKGAVAIEIPNAERIKIPFGNVFYSDYGNMVLPASLGVDPKGKPVYLDIADAPHLLIAGTTGAGKSVCLNTIITSLMLNCRPTDLQFLLIDPKGNEFVQYEGVKSLISGKIIDDVETALDSLKWLVQEMERRYKILKNCRCRSIDEYRQRRNFGRIEGSLKYYIENLPYIVVVIDEYADLMMKSANALQENVKKLGQKARAAGIHLILATQRPSAKTIDGDIKANVPTRIALKVSSITDSKTILDYGGAERLLGRGDMFLKRQELQDPQRVHGCYISNEEIKKAIELLPQKKLYRVNEENVFANDIHNFYNVSTPEYLKAHAIWGELNAVSKIIMENFSEFMAGRHDEIYQVCASQLGMEKSRVDVVFSDVNNAINDSEFYQILLRLCSEHNKKCDCPFVKAVIYSSSLRLKNRIECDLFLDYIFEHVSEDDSWAYFVFNNCDLNEKLIQRMAERGDDRAIECICDWDVYSLSDSVKETIFQLAVQDKDVAVEKVAIWSSCYKLHERFGELSESGQNKALEILCRNARYYGCFDYAACIIFDLAKEGNERACECIDDNYDVFEERVIEFVDNQNFSDVKEFAKKINLLARIDCRKATLAKFVCFLADEGNADAKEIVYDERNCVDNDIFRQYIMRKAGEGDRDAWYCLELHCCRDECYDFYDYVRSCVWDPKEEVRSLARELVFDYCFDFREVVLELACDGDESAKDAIYDALESYKEEFCEFTLNDAQNGNGKSQRVVYKNPQIGSFRQYILDEAKLGDDDAIDAIYEHPEKEYFHEFKDCPDFILTRAKVGDEYAKNVVYSRPENTEFQKYIVKKARQGNSRAKSVVLNNFWMGLFRECICEMAASGDDVAKNVVLANVKYDLFQKCIVELADQGDAEAKKVVQENPEIALFQKSICELSISGDKDAKQVVLENPKKVLFQENICKLATLGDEDAKKIVFANAEKDLFRKCIVELVSQGDCIAKRVVFTNIKYRLFQNCIAQLALHGDDEAKNVEEVLKCVENGSQKEEYKGFLIEKCLERNEWAWTIICNNLDYYRNWINEVIKNLNEKNNLRKLLIEKIQHQAEFDEKLLKYVVCENPQEEKFKDLIAEKIKENNDVVECMCQYYLQKISSEKRKYFSEFVRQRVSKEFGLCFENDDDSLKRSIGHFYRNECLYFVLAKALGGNKLALDEFRSSFEVFGRVIIECLRDSDSQIWKYAMDCVKSETTGKIIKELAEKGNDMANEIVLNFQILCG